MRRDWLPGYDAWKTNVPEERSEKPERDPDIAREEKQERERLRHEWEEGEMNSDIPQGFTHEGYPTSFMNADYVLNDTGPSYRAVAFRGATTTETSAPECEDRPIVKPAEMEPKADDPLWEACQKFIMSLAEDPTLGQPAELHFWGLLKIRVYDFVCNQLTEARKQGRLDVYRTLDDQLKTSREHVQKCIAELEGTEHAE